MSNFDKKNADVERLLSDLLWSTRAAVVAVVSTTPSGVLRVLQVAGSGSFVRSFEHSGNLEDRAIWQAILNNKSSTAQAQEGEASWLGRAGFAHALAIPLNDVLFAGYPAALVAYRPAGREVFSSADQEILRNAARELTELYAPRAEQSGAAGKRRFFVIDAKGEFVGISPASSQGDDAIAERLGYIGRKLAADKSEVLRKDAGNRVLIADSSGETTPWRVVRFNKISAVGDGSFTVLAEVPHWQEWKALLPGDFAALPEIGLLLPAIQLMADRFADAIVLNDIAKAVHLSQYHFHRRFTDLLGITPKHYLFDRQVDRAKELLIEGTTSLADIARVCGFAHQSHFTSRFRQSTGLTPTRWRKMKLASQKRTTGFSTTGQKPTLQARAG